VWRGRTSGGGRGIIRGFTAVTGSVEQKRVQFDFEIAFSNGGGLKGWDFRLDIDGDDISDEVLAKYIVRDLRLLMVGSVAISNKKIISEPHKRVS
jgi:hypothetical protein